MTKITKNELKRNELGEWLKLSVYYFKNNLKVLIVTISSILFIIIAGSSIIYMKKNNNKLSAEMFSQAMETYHLGDTKTGEITKTNLIDSIAILKNIIEKYPNTQSAALAYYYLGNFYFELADYQQALSQYQYFVNKYSNHSLIDAVRINIANIYELQKNYDEAVKIYENLVNSSTINAKQKDDLKLNLARVYELQNQILKAKNIYSSLPNNDQAQFRLGCLSDK